MSSQPKPLTLATEAPCEAPHLDGDATQLRRKRLMPPDAVSALADTFRILGDPTRVRMLDVLAGGELCVCDLAALVGISESAVSHQLRLLRGMRLVRPRRAGRQVFYSLDDQHIVALFQQALRHVLE
ncbi:MAG TPA: metalloregulator ArsR/SmtB family transcription factor [Vicinamibacterales bacterium]|nr:metalloregulator ArsR/SmtB family transcription factor [Vicinamibacterales bacterium]